MFTKLIKQIRTLYPDREAISLHEPLFAGREKAYTTQAIDSTFVSSVGAFVERFEQDICAFTGADYAVATVTGTAALHAALLAMGVRPEDEVLTQPLSFVATANAINYCGARPIFLDVERDTLGLSPAALEDFLTTHTICRDNTCYNRATQRRIAACVPMHTFGHPVRIEEVVAICRRHHIAVVEDAAEALGSKYRGRHCGTFGDLGIYSFNGNKTITCGGGGMVVGHDKKLTDRVRHLTTTAKIPHPWQYRHDQAGYNYRMPNLNAALGCAQLEMLPAFLADKRELAAEYEKILVAVPALEFIREPAEARSNYWLNALLTSDREQRDRLLAACHKEKIFCRPAWDLLNTLPMYNDCQTDNLTTANWLADRLVNLPSSVRQLNRQRTPEAV